LKVVFDIETNGLENPTKIWLIVCRELLNGAPGSLHIFRKVSDDEEEKERFLRFAAGVRLWIGHNCVGYDNPVLASLIGFEIPLEKCIDTYIISQLIDFSREPHSIESYGQEFGIEKIPFDDFSKYTEEMEEYCVRDVEIGAGIYRRYERKIPISIGNRALNTEQRMACVSRGIGHTGFGFDSDRSRILLDKVNVELSALDQKLMETFPPRLTLIREITPEYTKHGTLHRKDFRWVEGGDLSGFNGGPFCRCSWTDFNPDSHKQRIDVLRTAGWHPTDRTKTHIEIERTSRRRDRDPSIAWEERLRHLSIYGWKINDTNLNTLPSRAPQSAKTLARRITVESRRRTLTEWNSLVSEGDGRVHGKFLGIGTWTHRMSHQKPNMANISNSHDLNGKEKYLGAEMRSLFIAPKKKLLIGVDADGIQMRILAHYIKDPEFTKSLVEGRKEDETDTHSLNKRVLGDCCKTRDASKRFVYALILGAGLGKLSQILEAEVSETQEALDRLLRRYEGWSRLKQETAQKDAQRGFFSGLDGRRVRIPGDTVSERKHLALSGYLQNGEAVIMKMATLKWMDYLNANGYTGWRLVNLVHDEWQTEVDTRDIWYAREIAEVQCKALKEVGEELNLACPLLGTYGKNHDDPKTWTIGTNWKVTH
jgi:DNA polymerase I